MHPSSTTTRRCAHSRCHVGRGSGCWSRCGWRGRSTALTSLRPVRPVRLTSLLLVFELLLLTAPTLLLISLPSLPALAPDKGFVRRRCRPATTRLALHSCPRKHDTIPHQAAQKVPALKVRVQLQLPPRPTRMRRLPPSAPRDADAADDVHTGHENERQQERVAPAERVGGAVGAGDPAAAARSSATVAQPL